MLVRILVRGEREIRIAAPVTLLCELGQITKVIALPVRAVGVRTDSQLSLAHIL